ncbi:hypothetical protein DVH24_009467 [Malus domestica]|uniref:Bidirectional sugar transporter SWEET n=1 Tax=Malus domestica TaxID=3750 RepID=A0A498IQN8_MALDO|nr:hypothetical protein DVH24_009467 [Malus domestica]
MDVRNGHSSSRGLNDEVKKMREEWMNKEEKHRKAVELVYAAKPDDLEAQIRKWHRFLPLLVTHVWAAICVRKQLSGVNSQWDWCSHGTHICVGLHHFRVFIIFAPERERAKILGLFTAVLALFSAVALVSLFALHDKTRKLFCGLTATVFAIIMFSSPLSIMSTVVRTKSVEFMPFFLSLFSFLCGTSWFIYGLLGRDPFVAIPNGCGSGLGALQLILYFIYRDNKGKGSGTTKPNGAATTADESITINGAQDAHV